MKGKNYIFVFLLFVAALQFATADDGDDDEGFNAGITLTVRPLTNWNFYNTEYLEYTIQPSVLTTVELGLKYKNLLNLFFGVDYNYNDNYVGKIIDSKTFTKFVGMLGIKNFMLGATFGQIEGTAVWKGMPVPGQPERASVDTKYTQIDLMYVFFGEFLFSMYALGLSYINYHMPTDLGGGYQDDLKIDHYGVTFSMSSFRLHMDSLRIERKKGIRIYADLNIFFGFSHTDGFTDEGKRRMLFGSSMNWEGGFSPPVKWAVAYSQNASAGLCGGFPIGKRGFLGLGAGYDGTLLLGESGYIRHGLALKTHISF